MSKSWNANHSTGSMSRFLIKELEKKGQKDSYNWQYLSFYSLWFDGTAPTATQVLLCFDLTDIMTARISRGFLDLDSHGESLVDGPWEVFNVLAKAITMHYDEALWGFRVPIRSIEKVEFSFVLAIFSFTELFEFADASES